MSGPVPADTPNAPAATPNAIAVTSNRRMARR